MKVISSIGPASGPSAFDCHFLSYRYDARYGLKPDVSECWVMQAEGLTLHALLRTASTYDGLWRSPAGHVYVIQLEKLLVNRNPRPRAAPFEEQTFPCVLRGVWGIDDDFVLVWGAGPKGEAMFRWNGKRWLEMPSPGHILSVHGTHPDLVYAAGEDGLIARWDGAKWTRLTAPVPGLVSSIFVVTRDQMYATQGNYLFEGSIYGWSVFLEHTEPIHAVAKYGDRVLVASRTDGLLRLEGQVLLPEEPEYNVEYFDTRGKLVLSCPDRVAEPKPEGKGFTGFTIEYPQQMMSQEEPLWLPQGGDHET